MQKVYVRNRPKPVTDIPSQANEKILHFSLQDALPAGSTLVLNTTFGTLSYLSCENNMPRLVRQEQFTNTEMSVLMPLLDLFPYYCPYEVLYGSFYGDGKSSELNTGRARARLEQAEIDGTWDQEMRPIRCALSRARLKIRSFGVDISSILATGYILLVSSQPMRDE